MSDAGRELIELKREIIEARNQAIKTDNQVKNLGLDVKGFEQRFNDLERRTRIASIGVHVIVASVIIVAATLVSVVRENSRRGEVEQLQKQLETARGEAERQQAAVEARLKEIEETRQRGETSRAAALEVHRHLEAKRDREAADLLPSIDLDALTSLERIVLADRITELRQRSAEAAYKAGKIAVTANRLDSAVKELARCLELEPEGPFAERARYVEATTLYELKRYDQAEPLLRELHATSTDKTLVDEARFLLGAVLARLGKRDESKELLQAAAASGRYQALARSHLAALESGSPFPGDADPKKLVPVH